MRRGILGDLGWLFELIPWHSELCSILFKGDTGAELYVMTESSQIDLVMESVSATMGITFVPRMIAHEKRKVARHLTIKGPSFYWHLALISRWGSYLSEADKCWLEPG